MRPSNVLSEQKLQKCDHTGDGGAGVEWEGRKVAKMRLLNAAIEQKLSKCDHQMLRVSESCKNATIEY